MKILHVNKFLYRRGGAESYLLDLAELQTAAGHDVAFFSTAHPSNQPSDFQAFFPPYVELDPPPAGITDKLRATGTILYSREAERGIEEVLRRFRPDVVHLHNVYHHLSPSILRPIGRRGIPAVMTLHDFKLACPTHRFMAGDEVCEACLPRRYYMPIVRRCNGGSIAASAVNAIEATLHTAVGAYGTVGLFVCPSRFLMEKMRAARVYPERLRWIPNFVHVEAITPKREPGRGIVYVGRLSHEKGVDVLVRAAAAASVAVDVVGDGPLRAALEALARDVGADVRFHGRVDADEVHRRLGGAIASVMPSRGYENTPIAILESFAAGTAVIGAGHGGIPELIEPGVDGELFAPGDVAALAGALSAASGDPTGWMARGAAARRKVEERYAAEGHRERLEEVYVQAAARLATTRA